MTSALLGLALILLIAIVAVLLGALTRLLAARIVASGVPRDGSGEHARRGGRDRGGVLLTPLDRIALGNEIIARDLRPDDTHPIARTAPRDARAGWVDAPMQRQDLAVRYPEIAAHALR
ncbi:hypothetical protein [Brachybacterium sp. FME24]|uniref:hypothetical protein n=1 Tax=Brachybacterium sp. FME24 TaxID=2742605 RepID=UPI001868CD1D|nr:hypothetical protein [Brachybacterium sp. FME24]